MKAFREILQVDTLSIAVRTSEKSGNKTYFRCKIDLRDDRTGEPRYSDYVETGVVKKVPCEKRIRVPWKDPSQVALRQRRLRGERQV